MCDTLRCNKVLRTRGPTKEGCISFATVCRRGRLLASFIGSLPLQVGTVSKGCSGVTRFSYRILSTTRRLSGARWKHVMPSMWGTQSVHNVTCLSYVVFADPLVQKLYRGRGLAAFNGSLVKGFLQSPHHFSALSKANSAPDLRSPWSPPSSAAGAVSLAASDLMPKPPGEPEALSAGISLPSPPLATRIRGASEGH